MSSDIFFASDNASGVHPEIFQAMEQANSIGHAVSYGEDGITEKFHAEMKTVFGANSRAYLVYNGTAANVISIRSLLKGYNSVLAPPTAHLEEDECGSLEAISGNKIEHLPHDGGKIRAEDIPAKLGRRGFVHSTQPGMVSITQSTELGLVYSPEELRAIGDLCREEGLLFHMDGARISNAVASVLASSHPGWARLSDDELISLGRDILRSMTLDAGVHALSLGGTKNGLMFGEAVILMNGAQENGDLEFYRKQGAQLASKMRYISAQFNALFGSSLWLKNALRANEAARRLQQGVNEIISRHRDVLTNDRGGKIRIIHPPQANAVFLTIPRKWGAALQDRFRFYNWDEESYRLMCSWDTADETVDDFLSMLEGLISHS
ncbi:threonine aldolase family protein [Salinispira pacifica]|uniref:Low-specificity L-threonine aldolase n=1 Tax=Salinispira pacifica TaxID=1307761 RepID=V5WL79_9SPIO|nr:beta-eliminating lyase-related protein [Salinispira pacifica]AHC16319.1 Low-specificity L-threonine aldolase [Salinispira pacifica]